MLNSNSNKYAFILGHVPELSGAEIIKVLGSQNIIFETVLSSKDFLLVEVGGELDVKALQERLGGTIKISRIMYHVSQEELGDKVEEIIAAKRPNNQEQKFQFGFSLYGKMDLKEFQNMGLALKRKLKNSGVVCRFVVSKEKSLSSVIIIKEHLIGQGLDVVIIEDGQKYYLGYTVAVQDFRDYSDRDFGRPMRDSKSGMIPPKLAKIMLNLSGVNPLAVILDPFCGSGTILQEALLMGYKNLIGSDLSIKAVDDTKNNLNWLKAKYNLDISGIKVLELDVRNLSKKVVAESINAIVTEPYLGEAKSSKLKTQNFLALAELYIQSFKEFYKVLKPNGKVVMILPIIEGQKMEILDQVTKIGFTMENLSDNPRSSIVYGREGTRVEREIFVFKKK
ncbi:MAG: DNA methyltransferase [Patescibacteria group bacterium]|jgi:tRNA (guanine10-N2)-dimethyltransferase